MTPLADLPAAAAVLAALVCRMVPARQYNRPATLPHSPGLGMALRAGGRHRYESAHPGSLSATAILRALNDEARRR